MPLVTTVTSTISAVPFGDDTTLGVASTLIGDDSLAGERSTLDFNDRSSVLRLVIRALVSLAVIYDIAGLGEMPREAVLRTPNLLPYDDGLFEYNLL